MDPDHAWPGSTRAAPGAEPGTDAREHGRNAFPGGLRRDIAADYDRAAHDYDQRHGDARSEKRFRVIDAPQLAIARGAERVLEIGCGTGRLLAQTRAPVRVGIDISQMMLARARQHRLHLAAADAHALPFASQSFDAILAGKGVFRYLDYERAFCECARVLRPGGRLAVHQYAAQTWSPRDLVRSPRPGSALHVRSLDQLYEPARRAGLHAVRAHLWRSVRVPPYALPVPVWMPGRLWSHCVVIFARKNPTGPAGAGTGGRAACTGDST